MKPASVASVVRASIAAGLIALLPQRLLAAEVTGAGPPPAEPPAAALTVKVQGLRNSKGHLAVALFDSAAGFPARERAVRGQLVRIEGGRAVATFHDLHPGTYAVAILHDENGNREMDFNFLGMPLEGYGFSNDAAALFGPPSFARAAFRLLPRPSVVAISVRYFSL